MTVIEWIDVCIKCGRVFGKNRKGLKNKKKMGSLWFYINSLAIVG